jgi:hypothetical protein
MPKDKTSFGGFLGLGADKPKTPPTGSGMIKKTATAIDDRKMARKKAICEMADGGYWNAETGECMSQPPQDQGGQVPPPR